MASAKAKPCGHSLRHKENHLSHDFIIHALNEQGDVVKRACFFGLANDIAYTCFPHGEEHFAGVSGGGRGAIITRSEAIQSLEKLIEAFDAMNYPDPTRADELDDFLKWARGEGSACQRFETIWA